MAMLELRQQVAGERPQREQEATAHALASALGADVPALRRRSSRRMCPPKYSRSNSALRHVSPQRDHDRGAAADDVAHPRLLRRQRLDDRRARRRAGGSASARRSCRRSPRSPRTGRGTGLRGSLRAAPPCRDARDQRVVLIMPGSTITDWIPNGASSCASPSPSPSWANLRRAVHRHAEAAHAPADRGDGHDPPAARLAHVRKHRLGDGDRAEHVGLEQLADLLLGAVLDGSRAGRPRRC